MTISLSNELLITECKGVGEDVKVNWVKSLKIHHKATFVGLQEAHISDFTNINLKGCWDSNEYDYDGVDSSGGSRTEVNRGPLYKKKCNALKF